MRTLISSCTTCATLTENPLTPPDAIVPPMFIWTGPCQVCGGDTTHEVLGVKYTTAPTAEDR